MVFMNMSFINRYSKRQSTVETLVFGAEFIIMKVEVDTPPAI